MANTNKLDISKNIHIRPLTEPRIYPVNYLESEDVLPITICGVTNPFGPTLTVIAAINDNTSAPPALVYAYLSPFKSELFILGYMFPGELTNRFADQIVEVLEPFELFKESTPNLCIHSCNVDDLDERYFLSKLLSKSLNLHRLLGQFTRFPLNPWDRIQENVDLGIESPDLGSLQSLDSTISDKDLNSFLDVVLDENHNRIELQAFASAWRGSIEVNKQNGNVEPLSNNLDADRFMPLLAKLLTDSGLHISA